MTKHRLDDIESARDMPVFSSDDAAILAAFRSRFFSPVEGGHKWLRAGSGVEAVEDHESLDCDPGFVNQSRRLLNFLDGYGF